MIENNADPSYFILHHKGNTQHSAHHWPWQQEDFWSHPTLVSELQLVRKRGDSYLAITQSPCVLAFRDNKHSLLSLEISQGHLSVLLLPVSRLKLSCIITVPVLFRSRKGPLCSKRESCKCKLHFKETSMWKGTCVLIFWSENASALQPGWGTCSARFNTNGMIPSYLFKESVAQNSKP